MTLTISLGALWCWLLTVGYSVAFWEGLTVSGAGLPALVYGCHGTCGCPCPPRPHNAVRFCARTNGRMASCNGTATSGSLRALDNSLLLKAQHGPPKSPFRFPGHSANLSRAAPLVALARFATPSHRTASVEPLATVPLPPSLLLADGMSVTFPAYLAIFLGTLIPVAFLIILYIQSESRKAGENSVRNE